jgi:hypothetical protein
MNVVGIHVQTGKGSERGSAAPCGIYVFLFGPSRVAITGSALRPAFLWCTARYEELLSALAVVSRHREITIKKPTVHKLTMLVWSQSYASGVVFDENPGTVQIVFRRSHNSMRRSL